MAGTEGERERERERARERERESKRVAGIMNVSYPSKSAKSHFPDSDVNPWEPDHNLSVLELRSSSALP